MCWNTFSRYTILDMVNCNYFLVGNILFYNLKFDMYFLKIKKISFEVIEITDSVVDLSSECFGTWLIHI